LTASAPPLVRSPSSTVSFSTTFLVFSHPTPTPTYSLSLHDALPIYRRRGRPARRPRLREHLQRRVHSPRRLATDPVCARAERGSLGVSKGAADGAARPDAENAKAGGSPRESAVSLAA